MAPPPLDYSTPSFPNTPAPGSRASRTTPGFSLVVRPTAWPERKHIGKLTFVVKGEKHPPLAAAGDGEIDRPWTGRDVCS